MALQKQPIQIPFAAGLDTKSDPNQIPIGKFSIFRNAIFTKFKLLQKRNGYQYLPSLPDSSNTLLTTFQDNLIAIGTSLNELSFNSATWYNKGTINSVTLSTIPIVRNNSAQTTVDFASTSNGIVCVTWKDSDGNNYYRVVDTNDGNIVTGSGQLEAGSALPRVFLLGSYFIVTYLVTVAAVVRLRYVAVPTVVSGSPVGPNEISNQVHDIAAAYDAISINGNLYFAWDASDAGRAIRLAYIDTTLTLHVVIAIAGQNASLISMTADSAGPTIWLSFINNTGTLKCRAFNSILGTVLTTTTVTTGLTSTELTSSAQSSVLTMLYQNTNTYSFSVTRSDFVSKATCTQSGTVGSPSVLLRGVGLAAKSFIFNSNIYVVVTYGGAFQPTYFLIDLSGNVICKLSQGNGGGYASTYILPTTLVYSNTVQFGYLFKDQVIPVNKDQGVTTVGGIYGQLGIKMASIIFGATPQTLEIANSLILNGGLVRMYDGLVPVELGFNVWPEDLGFSTSTTGGSLTAQVYNYMATYEWTDSQGNIHRSAPSVPLVVDISLSGTSTNKNTINVPTLRQTYKVGKNPVRIVIYRWSTAQQNFYQITSITSPTSNSTTTDSISFVDTQADSSIIGNELIYTTGGILENDAPPAANAMITHRSRLFLVDAEDTSLVWFSKQVIENTPIEMSGFLTKFLSPTISASGSAGPIRTLYSMDDKLIAFKSDNHYYMTGNGPDNTGANDDFSEFTFISSTVGCSNQSSLAFLPNGIIFQSDKGIWLLGRDLSTQYIGAPVEDFNSSDILSALTIPGTNQVRFILDSGSTLMYDYYFDQWGEFVNTPALSATLFQGFHTLLNSHGQVLQETQGMFLDGSSPVLMSLQTAWINLMGLQGFQRAYYFYLLGKYLTPHKLQLQLSYDYDPSFVQNTTIQPNNFNPVYGTDPLYGSSTPYGGPSAVEWWRVFLNKQKCSSIQITISEIYDPSLGVAAGAGLNLSGINMVIGAKKPYPVLIPSQSTG